MVDINIEHLKSVLSYNVDTGLFTWLINRGPVKAGDIAGTDTYGYITIRYNMIKYLAHRLAWLYIYGQWPTKDIDHINGDKKDNRINNLRVCTGTQNNQNRLVGNRILKYRGIYKVGNKYAAHIKINNTSTYLGLYSSAIEAAKVYEDKAKEVHKEFYKEPEYIKELAHVIPTLIKQTNITGFTGVSKSGNKFKAQIKVKGIKVHLGTFNTPEEAYLVYLDKKKELGR